MYKFVILPGIYSIHFGMLFSAGRLLDMGSCLNGLITTEPESLSVDRILEGFLHRSNVIASFPYLIVASPIIVHVFTSLLLLLLLLKTQSSISDRQFPRMAK